MNTELFSLILDSLNPYIAELAGAAIVASMISLFYARGTQKIVFNYLSTGFWMITCKDLALVALPIMPRFFPTWFMPPDLPLWITVCSSALAASFFLTAAVKNLKFIFSGVLFSGVLSLILIGIAYIVHQFPEETPLLNDLPKVYLIVSFAAIALSFYVGRRSAQQMSVRAVGTGFVILAVSYTYILWGFIQNDIVWLSGSYAALLFLSLASQISFMNLYSLTLEQALSLEKRRQTQIWEVSPFPIIISKLRDDTIIYINPVAQKFFDIQPWELNAFHFSDYFVVKQKREELTQYIRNEGIINSFEVQMKHPKRNEIVWIDLSTRVIDLDEEIALYTTFKDITLRKDEELKLAEQATTDPLTQLYNRRQFEVMATQQLTLAARHQIPFCLFMLDIDHFKQVNDTYGHDAGDTVLKKLASTIQTTMRKSDISARYGGEEFVIFLPHTSPEQGKNAAEHLRRDVERLEIDINGKQIAITISLGISSGMTTDLAGLIKEADIALYHSKENGRNQTTLYEDLPLTPDREEKEK